jgi:hypothetical protein
LLVREWGFVLRARVLTFVLVLVLAATAAAQDSPLKKKWERAHGAFLEATARVLSLTREIQQIDRKKAEIQSKIDAIDKQPASFFRDRDRQTLVVEIRTLLDNNNYPKLLTELRSAETAEINARDAALDAAWEYVPHLFKFAEWDFDNKRLKPGTDKLDEAARVLTEIGKLEGHNVAPLDTSTIIDRGQIPENPIKRLAFAKMCKDEAELAWDEVKKVHDLWKSLEPEKSRLASIVAKGYATDGRAQNMLGLISARLDSLEQRRKVLSERANQYDDLAKKAQ